MLIQLKFHRLISKSAIEIIHSLMECFEYSYKKSHELILKQLIFFASIPINHNNYILLMFKIDGFMRSL